MRVSLGIWSGIECAIILPPVCILERECYAHLIVDPPGLKARHHHDPFF